MPNTHSTLTSLFTDIANAIRAKTGSSATIVADNFPTAIGNIMVGTGLAYETGTYAPTSDAAANTVTISFTNTHSSAPIYILLVDDATNQAGFDSTDSLDNFWYCDIYNALGAYCIAYTSSSTPLQGSWGIHIRTSGGALSTSITNMSSTPSTSFTSTGFKVPHSSSYYRGGRTYKWIAVWAPAT